MFTEQFLTKFGQVVKIGNIFSFPYIWNVKHNRLGFNSWNYAKLIILQIFIILHAIVILYQAVAFRHLGDDPTTFNFLLLGFYIMAGVGLSECVLIVNGKAMACLWNSLILYSTEFSGNIFTVAARPETSYTVQIHEISGKDSKNFVNIKFEAK